MFTKQLHILQQKRSFYFLLAGTLIMLVVMFLSGKPLQTTETPAGIVELELAATPATATAVIKIWEQASTEHRNLITTARINTWLDFAFLFFYSFFLCSCMLMLSRRLGRGISRLLIIAAPFILLAGMLDVFENVGMLLSLGGRINTSVIGFTFTCSLVKWMIVMASLLLLIWACLLYMIGKNKRP